MTILAMDVAADRAVMISDGAAYDDDGIVGAIHSKQIISPEGNFVLAFTGEGPVREALRHHFAWEQPPSFDELLSILPDALREIDRLMRDGAPDVPAAQFHVLVAGWSEGVERCRGFIIGNYIAERWGLDEAFKLCVISQIVTRNASQEALSKFAIDAGDLKEAQARLGVAEFLVCYALAARDTPATFHARTEEKGFVVGGFLQLTTLERDIVSSRILVRWPDPIGEVIDPARTRSFA